MPASMQESDRRPIREVLLSLAALAVSIFSLLPLFWAFFMLGDYGSRDLDPFPGFLRDAAAVSLVIILIGAFSIAPYWRGYPWMLAFVAAAPYLLCIEARDSTGVVIWSGAALLVFLLFYIAARMRRRPQDQPPRDQSFNQKSSS